MRSRLRDRNQSSRITLPRYGLQAGIRLAWRAESLSVSPIDQAGLGTSSGQASHKLDVRAGVPFMYLWSTRSRSTKGTHTMMYGYGQLGFLWMMLFWVGAVLLAIWAINGRNEFPGKARTDNRALAILEERFARGEIDVDELQTRRQQLGG